MTELRPLRARAHRNLRAAFATIAERLGEAGLLRTDVRTAADTIYALATETTYLRMTEGAGLSTDAYAGWLADTLAAALLKRSSLSRVVSSGADSGMHRRGWRSPVTWLVPGVLARSPAHVRRGEAPGSCPRTSDSGH